MAEKNQVVPDDLVAPFCTKGEGVCGGVGRGEDAIVEWRKRELVQGGTETPHTMHFVCRVQSSLIPVKIYFLIIIFFFTLSETSG